MHHATRGRRSKSSPRARSPRVHACARGAQRTAGHPLPMQASMNSQAILSSLHASDAHACAQSPHRLQAMLALTSRARC
eukprot:258345-Chlamydomonas_euryale.AAC.1